MWLLATFQRNLHSIREQPSTNQSRISSYLCSPFLMFVYFLILFISLSFLPSFQELENTYLHILSILGIVFLFILPPKHYINQNPNLKLYVSVYNHQPPPVLPWQLPSNFDHNSVKLICAKYKNE